MLMLLALVVQLAAAFPASWNETTCCPHDALYTSLFVDGGGFCSSVLEGNQCGAGYSTPAEYVRYNQTRIASYCECILTGTNALTTSSNSSKTTIPESSVTVGYPDSQSMDGETSASVGQPASGRYTETITTREPASTAPGHSNKTRSASTFIGETTGDVSRTSLYSNTSKSATETFNQRLTSSESSWNFTTSDSPSSTRDAISVSSPSIQNQTSGIAPTSSLFQSGNKSQTLQSTMGITSQASDTHESGAYFWKLNVESFGEWHTSDGLNVYRVELESDHLEYQYFWHRQFCTVPNCAVSDNFFFLSFRGPFAWEYGACQYTPWVICSVSDAIISESNFLRRSYPWKQPGPELEQYFSAFWEQRVRPYNQHTSNGNFGSHSNFTISNISQTDSLVPFPTISLPTGSPSITSDVTHSAMGNSGVPNRNGTASSIGSNISLPITSLSQTGISTPLPTVPLPIITLPTVTGANSSTTRSNGIVPSSNSTIGGSVSMPTISSFESEPVIPLPTDSEVMSSGTQSGDFGWNISSISGIVSLPTISVPASEVPVPIPSLPFPTDSWEVPSSSESGTIAPSGNISSSAVGNTGSVTSFSSPVATASTSSGTPDGSAPSDGNATNTGVPEFPAANFTHVTRTAVLSEETCHSLASDPGGAARRALLYNARLREDNVTIPVPYIQSVEFQSDGVYPLYLTVRNELGETYFVDISHRGRLSVVDPSGYLVTLDAKGIHFSGSNCTYDVSITIDNMYEQIADLAGAQCAALQRRADDLDFRQVLFLHDQCGSVVDKSLRQYPQLLVGDTVCADVAFDEETGQWDFDCTFPGSQSGSLKCQWAIENSIINFITIDPFGGSCPDLTTVVTTLEESAQDIVDPVELRKDLANQELPTDRAKQEADAAVVAYTQLWQALGSFFSKNTESSPGALEEYIDVYNAHRSFENDICQSLHEGEIPLNLTLIAGATRIPAITTLNWAPESTRPYNITVQDSSRIACCPNGSDAEGEGSECAYPREAIIPGTFDGVF
ncbi:hypothetical protein FGRMN_8619 [Fusarium graminum]|nr:hypothetical protein FGRMN_8619 [Fusarium graminum]